MTCGYCQREMTKQEGRIAGAFQAFPEPSKPVCGNAACLAAAKAESERG